MSSSPMCESIYPLSYADMREEVAFTLPRAKFRRFCQWLPARAEGGIIGAIMKTDAPFEPFSERYGVAISTLWLADAVFDASPAKDAPGALSAHDFAHAFYAALPDQPTDRVWRAFAENAILRLCQRPTEQVYLRAIVEFTCSSAAVVRAQAREHLYYCRQTAAQRGATFLADWAVESCILLESKGSEAAQEVIYNFVQAVCESGRNVAWMQRLFLSMLRSPPVERKPERVKRASDIADAITQATELFPALA